MATGYGFGALLERRPDVAAAERTLASATAQIGVVKGNFFPSIKLIGHGGYLSGDSANLFEVSSLNWNVGPSISVPLMAGGKNRAASERSRAAHDEALANYRQAVLTAFQEVEDNLAALRDMDPKNRLLARGARFRVPAETVRDIQLATSGLLDGKMGGRSVFPPAPGYLFQRPVSYGPKTWDVETDSNR